MTKEEIYTKYLERLKLKLIAKYDELGLRASGKYADELELFKSAFNLTDEQLDQLFIEADKL